MNWLEVMGGIFLTLLAMLLLGAAVAAWKHSREGRIHALRKEVRSLRSKLEAKCVRCKGTGKVQRTMGPGSMGWQEACPCCTLEGSA